jgi:hypothetical protein
MQSGVGRLPGAHSYSKSQTTILAPLSCRERLAADHPRQAGMRRPERCPTGYIATSSIPFDFKGLEWTVAVAWDPTPSASQPTVRALLPPEVLLPFAFAGTMDGEDDVDGWIPARSALATMRIIRSRFGAFPRPNSISTPILRSDVATRRRTRSDLVPLLNARLLGPGTALLRLAPNGYRPSVRLFPKCFVDVP